ncbi:MAG: DNA replication/repair protein RecF [Candidatus Caldatribacteriaceae bacterium]
MIPSMHFEDVRVRAFRNLLSVDVSLAERCIFIVGDNAQGKSNFLEALFLLARGFSPRGARDAEVICFGEEAAFLRGKIGGEGNTFTKEVVVRRSGGKEWRVNGKRLRKEEPVWLTGYFPEDGAIVGGAPRDRRDFFDEAISFLSPLYRQFLRDYEKVVERRNWLLREGKSREVVSVYTERMMGLALRIVEWRVKYIGVFGPLLGEVYRNIFGGGELRVRYRSEGYSWEEGIQEGLRKAWKMLEQEELERGMTLFGPHRDEFLFLLGDREVRDFASQGEKKGVALALRLSEMEVMKRSKKGRVVVLLDDLFSEFDEKRRDLVLKAVWEGNQVVVTTTEKDVAERLGKELGAWGFTMEGGQMERWW